MIASTLAEQTFSLAALDAAGVPALRVVFTIAVAVFLAVGWFIYRNRHMLFDRDADVDNDFAVVRHLRLENIVFVWGALVIVLVCVFVDVWRA
jgi:hypothetical protein